ncbi:MAG: DNA translocase FtsK [Bacilli bacterium]|nr:DNA translocase FtsK [Bacilli bacterium]
MAKKKKKKDTKKKNVGYYTELLGLFYIVLALLGLGQFGVIGKLITSFASFLVGTWHYVLLAMIFIIGIYMMVKREKPNYFTSKLLGLYVLIIAILLFSHINYIKDTELKNFDVIVNTVTNFMGSTYDINNVQGGGILGSIFAAIGLQLFSYEGTVIVAWTLAICGFVMFTGITIADMVTNLNQKTKNIISKFKKNKIEEDIKKAEQEFDKEGKIVITSVDDLINIHDNQVTDKPKPVVTEVSNQEIKENTESYLLPPLTLLSPSAINKKNNNHEDVKDKVKLLEQVLTDFDINGKVVAINIGPAVTQYELEIKAGTKVNKILSIHREIALALAAKDVRIQAPIPGKRTIGIELPNKHISMVTVREILEKIPKKLDDIKLIVSLGKNIMGEPIYFDISKTPHLLVAGATGSGKSVCINSMIISILMRTKPDEVKLLLVDPKKVELSMYNGVPHLMAPVVTDSRLANTALKKIVVEMERRYELFSDSGTKNIAGYNMYLQKKNEKLSDNDKVKKLPYIVAIIDELADLMLVAAKEVEDSILRITQMARAAGIHLIVATQRPSTDVITGLIKANIPSRISFSVSSSIDSRTILDMSGAEKLLGKGDMLFVPMGENIPLRIQGTFISEEEIKAIVDHTISQQKAKYDETLLMTNEEMNATTMVDERDAYEEPLYNEIVEFVIREGKASTSLIQRRFRLGYNRAARVVDLMEERGIIGPSNGSKPREVLVQFDSDKDE